MRVALFALILTGCGAAVEVMDAGDGGSRLCVGAGGCTPPDESDGGAP